MKSEYYPEDKEFIEISMRFLGDRRKPLDIKCYNKLKHLTKELDLDYPELIVQYKDSSYGSFLRYECRSILEKGNQKNDKIKAIYDELIKYGIKNKSIPIIELIRYGDKTVVYELKDYLKSKKIGLEDLYRVKTGTFLEERGE